MSRRCVLAARTVETGAGDVASTGPYAAAVGEASKIEPSGGPGSTEAKHPLSGVPTWVVRVFEGYRPCTE